MAKVSSTRNKAVDDVLAQINKQIKSDLGDVLNVFGDKPYNKEVISTGSLVLDSKLGGGLAKGRIIEIYGPEASGKTSMALTALGNAQAGGGIGAFIDLEHALDPIYASTLGVDMDNLIFAQPDYGEQAMEIVSKLTDSGIVDIIVIDSVAALVPKAELEGTMEDHTIGAVARLLSKALRQLVASAAKNGVTLVFINQTRAQIGGFSPVGVPETTTGGKALQFYASQRIRVSRGQQVKEGTTVIGNIMKFNVKKNKIAPPFLTGETILTFAKGINRAAELIEVGPDYGVIEKPNNRTYIEAETGEKLGTSKSDAIAAIENDEVIFNRIAAAFSAAVSNNLMGEAAEKVAKGAETDPDEDDEDI